MANIKNILPDKRRITVLVSIIFLLALFLVPYFLVFIPANASNLKRQAFLKLNRAAQNMNSKSNDTRSYYRNTASAPGITSLDTTTMNSVECSTAGKERLSFSDSVYFIYHDASWNILFIQQYRRVPDSSTLGHARPKPHATKHGHSKSKPNSTKHVHAKPKPDSSANASVKPLPDSSTNGHSTPRSDSLNYGHLQPLSDFMTTCTPAGKEVFDAFLLVHYCQRMGRDTAGKIIYQDYQPGMEQDIIMDSLIPRHEGLRSPDMNDITLEGTDYKLFSYPFQLGRHRMVICGLMKTDRYNAQLRAIPVGTSYTLIICLVLFLFSLPFLKIFMMNERDRVHALNIFVGVAFLFGMASFITIVTTQLILLNQGRAHVRANLDSLSVKLEDSLRSELRLAQNEMKYFDSSLRNYMDIRNNDWKFSDPHTPAFLIQVDANNLKQVFDDNTRIFYGHHPLYHNADHMGWLNDSGQELVRIRYISPQMDKALRDEQNNLDTIQFVNAWTRPYFQELYSRSSYKDSVDSTLIIAPVQSWASGEFRVNLCRYSSVIPDYMVQVMETRLYSLVNTVLPAGYGYCLFNADGNTQIHSDTVKSLRENFLDETGRLPWILGSLKGRQVIRAGSVPFYGSNYTLRIQPLKQHPLFLAVFYNNDYLEPVNLRILSFSLFFSLLTYGLLYLFFLILYRREPRTFLFSPMEYYWRIVPSSEKFRLYFNGSILLIAYIVVSSLASIFSPWIGFDVDYTVLALGLLTPFIGLYSLWLLQRRMGMLNRVESKKWVLPVFVAGFGIYGISYFLGWPLEPVSYFTMVAGVALLIRTIVIRKNTTWIGRSAGLKKRIRRFVRWDRKSIEEKKLFSYSVFVSLFIFAIAVLPALEYSWYAYTHELRQSVKKEQLEIADGIQQREKHIRSFLKNNQPAFTGNDSNFRTIQFHQGIYPFYAGRISTRKDGSDTFPRETDHDRRSEAFYLSIAGTLNTFYRDPAGLPPLYDSLREDNLYHWTVGRDSCTLSWSKPRWKIPASLKDTLSPPYNFKMISRLPSGLRIDGRLMLTFGIMLIGLLLAIYWIIRTMARQIYLTKIIEDAGPGLNNRYTGKGDDFWSKCLTVEYEKTGVRMDQKTAAARFLGSLKSEYVAFDQKTSLILFESDVMAWTAKNAAVFECLWKTLNDREKYLLYCLASDGLLNYKNEPVIYGLLNKNLLVIYNQRIRFVSYSFREFIISRRLTDEEKKLFAEMQLGASWTNLKTMVLVIIMSVFVFLYLTQQEVSAKIIALITSLSAILPFLLKLGSSGAAGGGDKK